MSFISLSLRWLVVCLTTLVISPECFWGQVNVVTQHNDIGRTGQNLNETTLTTANVSSGNFGKLFSLPVDGQVYAQPLYLSGLAIPNSGTHNVVFVATMHDSVYAFDGDSGTALWHVTLLDAAHGASAGATTDPTSDTGCSQIQGGEIGITSTPVIDPVAGVIYVVGKTYENNYPVQRLHALSVTTGAEMASSPVTLSGSVTGSGSGSSNGVLTFDPKWENQRAGLLLVNGIVYLAFGNYCEHGTGHGWIMAYNTSTLTQTSAFVTTPNGTGSGIWMGGTGLSADVPAGSPFGRLFVALGNGTYDATAPYGTNTMDYGDDVLQLDLTNGVMTVTDQFTPMDQANLQSTGMDLGSGGVMLLPDQALAGHTHQMLAGGKNGNLYLIDRDSLGGYSTTANNIIEPIVPNQVGGVFGGPAYWNNSVYYWGDEDTLKQFNFTNGLMNFWHSANSTESQSYPASAPSISANGTTNGIVWNIDASAASSGGNAKLLAHSGQNVATTLYTSAANTARDNPGTAVKFSVPTIANGKVYVPAGGQVSVYGLLAAPDFTLTPAQTNVSVAQGASVSDSITVGPINGFSGVLTLSVSGMPSGMTVAFTQDLTGFIKYAAFSTSSTTATGTYAVVVTATAGTLVHNTTVNVTVTVPVTQSPAFSLNAGPQIVPLVQGQSNTANIGIVPANGFNSAVTFSAAGLPAGVTASFGAVTNNVSALTLTAASNAAAGVYPVAIQGSGGSITSSTNLTLMVNNVGQVNVLTQHNDIARSGQNLNETILTPQSVSGGNFGKLFSQNLDGQVYAQPLYMANVTIPNAGTHNVVYVATMHDSVYAFDADSAGAPLWQITLLDAAHGASTGATTDPVTDPGCDELLGTELGITGTPVIDPGSGTMYLVGKTFENGYPVQRLHALDITTGAEKMPPVVLSAAVAGTGAGSSNNILTFDPKWENQRPGLLLVNGMVYIAFASYCDNGPYHGWILGYNGQNLVQTSVFTPTPNASGSGIWMSGSGPAADIPAGSPFGRMFVATGNGTYDATTPYQTNQADFAVDVIRFDLTNGIMTVTDAFTPMDQATLSQNDSDLASGGVMLLPDSTLAGHTHQLLAAGKTGIIYVVDRDSMGGYSPTANNIIETISPKQIGGVFSSPAYWNNQVYYWGISDYLNEFNFTNGLLNAYHSGSSTEKQTFPGSAPAISANGTTGGVVWNIDSSAYQNYGNANLIAHDASNVANTLYTSATNASRDNPGLAVKDTVPTISNGKVYVPAYGQLSVYGLLPSTPDFTVSATQSSVTMVQGGSTGSTITVGALNGFSGSVTLSTSGVPTGVLAVLTAGTTANATTLTLTSTSAAAFGSFLLTVTGTSGGLSHSTVIFVTVTNPNAPSFSLTAAPSIVSIVQGQSGTSNITIVPVNGFAGAVKLVAYGLPAGTTAAFGPVSNGISVMTITVPTSAASGNYPLTIAGSSGTVAATATVTLTIGSQPNFSLTAAPNAVALVNGQSGSATVNIAAVNGFNSSVNFTASGLPTGLTAAFSPASSATGSNITFTAASTVGANTYPVLITGMSGGITSSVTINVTVNLPPSFLLTASPATISVGEGQSATSNITVVPTNGFTGAVTFATSTLPTGVTASFGTAANGVSVMTIAASASAAAQQFNVAVTGTSGALTATTNVSVTISAVPTFTLTAPSSLTLTPGQSNNATVTVVASSGFGSAVSFSVSGLPTGVTAAFSQSSSATSTNVTFSAASSVTANTYPIVITGTSGVTSSVTLNLVIGYFPQVNVVTQHNDISRSGQNLNETILTPANVSSGNFGKLYSVTVDGQVFAQPLYLQGQSIAGNGTHNVVFVPTMHDSVYAFDADSGAQLWRITLLDSAHGAAAGATTDPVSDTNCTAMAGTEMGIAGTPVIDPVAGVMYLVGKTFENGYPVQRLHALNVATGAEMPNSPVTLTASVAGSGSGSVNGVLSFDPKWENQRAGLLLLNGMVYMAFSSYCDNGPFHGWVLAYNATTLAQTSVFTPSPNASGSGIGMSGTGLAADVPAGSPFGRLYIPTGHGTYDATAPYGTNTMDYAMDVLRLDLTNGVMKVTDAFTPFDQATLSSNSSDLSSGGIMLLPDEPLTGHTHQLLAGGKTGNMYLVDRDSLGGYSSTANNIVQYVSPNQIGGVFGSPAYWNNTIYYWTNSDTLKQFGFSNGLMNFWHSQNSSESMKYPGSTPSISANGNTNGIVWAVDSSTYSAPAGPAILYAHSATNVSTTLYSSATNATRDNPGPAVQNTVPTIANGKVYVAAYGQMSAFGLLNPDFSISEFQTSVSVQPGGSSSDLLTTTALYGFTGSVTYSTSTLPTGLTAAFAAGSVAGTTNMTFSATNSVATGTYPVVVTGTSGAISHSLIVNVTISATPFFTLTASPVGISLVQGQSGVSNITIVPANGFTGSVTLVTSAVPAGITASLGTISGGVSVLTVSAASAAAPQQFNLTVTGTAGALSALAVVPVTVAALPTFSLTPAASSVSLAPGQAGNLTVNVAPVYGFNSAVTFAASGLPSGLTAAFNPASSATGTSITFTAAGSLAVASYPIVITGTSGALTSSVNVTVVVGTATFSLSAPSAVAVQQGTSASSTIGITDLNGFSGTPTFSVSGLPSGVTAAIGSASATAVTIGFTATTAAVVGAYPIKVTGTAGSIVQSASFTLSVTHGLTLSGVQIIGMPTGVCLDVNGQSTAAGAGIGQSACWGGSNQIWTLTAISTGVYRITALNSGLALDITGSSTSAGALATQNTASSAASQHWTLQETSDGYFNIVNAGSSQCLDGSETSAATGANSRQQVCSTAASQKWSLVPLSNTTSVNMSASYNVNAIATTGTAPANGGLDGTGYAYPSSLLGSGYSWYGYSFVYGPANAPDAVSSATVALPAGQYNGLYFLVTATNGNQANQTFSVNYSDGTSTTVQQGINDWGSATPLYTGEQAALSVADRLNPSGQLQAATWYMFGFHINLDSSRTAVSVTLPNNRNVTVMAMTLGK